MIKKIIFTAATLAFMSTISFAQGVLKFQDDKHDFGMIDEGVQAVEEFTFTNTGNAPIILSDVRASCGCTTPSWTKEPIAPGAKGSIKASYNSEGRPGAFNKSITITSNASEPSKVLYIKGVVDPKKEKPTFTADQLKVSPKFSVDKSSHNFGKLEKGQKVTTKFIIKNTGKSPLTINSVNSACNCITHTLSAESIPSGKTATMEITYSPFYIGSNTDVLTIVTNDLNKNRHVISLTGDVVESLNSKSPISQDGTAVPFGK